MGVEYLTLGEAAELIGVSRFTLWRRIREADIPTYKSPRDRRYRMVKRADLEKILIPVEVQEENETAT